MKTKHCWRLFFLALVPLLAAAASGEHWVRLQWVVLNPRASLAYMRYDTAPAGRYRVHVIYLDLADPDLDLWPVAAPERARPDELARRYGAVAAINGGFFNLTDGVSVSYVTMGGTLAADPTRNASMMRDSRLRPFLGRVLNRSELRILADPQGRRYFSIAPHFAALPRGYRLWQALQAGPSLLPTVRLSEEGFVRPATRWGASQVAVNALSGTARSAIGLVSSQRAYLVMVQRNLDPGPPQGLTLAQLAGFMRGLGCYQALALDGGTSSSMYVQTNAAAPPQMLSGQGKQEPAAVKSALLVFYRARAPMNRGQWLAIHGPSRLARR